MTDFDAEEGVLDDLLRSFYADSGPASPLATTIARNRLARVIENELGLEGSRADEFAPWYAAPSGSARNALPGLVLDRLRAGERVSRHPRVAATITAAALGAVVFTLKRALSTSRGRAPSTTAALLEDPKVVTF